MTGGTFVTAEMQLATLREIFKTLRKMPPLTRQEAEGGKLAPGASPEGPEGPYYIDEVPDRQNIVEDRKGIPLNLRITVLDTTRRTPVREAVVNIWHCDALGWYSGHLDVSPDVFALSAENVPPTDSERFLRGIQRTDERGVVEFRTISPGWYYSRPVHIHLKVRISGREVYTGQLYFPEEYYKMIGELPPYRDHTTLERLPNEVDFIYQRTNGSQTTVEPRSVSPDKRELGFSASFTLAIVPD